MSKGDGFDELMSLAADLSNAPAEANRFIDKAMDVTARNIKDDWRQGAEIGPDDWNFADDYATSITYDKNYTPTSIEREIGPELGRRGGSAGFLEDGGRGVLSAPQHAGRNALRANEDDFIRGLEIALYDATKKAVEE